MDGLRTILTDLWRLGTGPWRSYQIRKLRSSGQIPIFVLFYHRIANKHPNPWSMDFATFQHQINWMRNRFEMISLEEVQRRIRNGTNETPAVSITFDDGYSENSEQALPFLIENKIPVTYFVTTEHTSKQLPFPHDVKAGKSLAVNSIESLKALAGAGIEIGAHTRTHPNLGEITCPERIFDEVITATRELEVLIGRKIRYFAFPYGQYGNLNLAALNLLRSAGFEAVCSAYGGWNNINNGDPFHIQRIHGDPDLARMKNWLTFDPRISRTRRYSNRPARKSFDWQAWLDGSRESVSPDVESNDDSPQISDVSDAASVDSHLEETSERSQ